MSQLRCYTCLQLDRKLSPLKAQDTFLFALLCPEMFIKTKDAAQYLICWECEFMADKIKRFQTRLKKANEILELSFKGKPTIIEGLSCLKITAIETISFTLPQSAPILPQNAPILPQNVPTLPLNVPMLPNVVPSIPQNILELSLKDMLAIPLKRGTQAEVKIEEEEGGHCSKDFDELIQTTTIMQVPISESDPLLIPRLKQPAEIEVLPQKPVKDEIIDPAINYVPQKLFINPPKDQVKLQGFRKDVKVTVEVPNLAASTEINPVLVHEHPVNSKKSDKQLTKLLLTPSKCEEFFLMRQRIPNSKPQKEPKWCERSGIDRQRVPNSNPPKESESSKQSSGVACEEDETKLIILNRTELNALRDKKRQNNAYIATSHKCERCIEWFLSQEKLDEHNLKHDMSRGNSICEICEQRFADDNLRNKHYRQHFIVYECHKCPCRYSNRVQLSTHCRKKHEESSFVCKKCFVVFKTFKERSTHMFQAHHQRIRCDECGKTFSTANMLRTHVLNIHKSKPVECPVCKKIVKKKSLKNHIKTHDEKTEDGAYCVDCGTIYKSKRIYELHLKNSRKHNSIEKLGNIHKSKPVECPVCKKIVKKMSLKNHMKTHDEKREDGAYCVDCGTIYKSKRIYELHLKNSLKHNSIEKLGFKCDHCDTYFANNFALKNHTEEIGGVKYTCDICKKDSKTKRSLTRHIQVIHEGKKPKRKLCEFCGKSFTVRKSLKEHLNVHLGIRPHVCKDCGDTFTYSAALFTHRRLKHKVKRKFEMASECAVNE